MSSISVTFDEIAAAAATADAVTARAALAAFLRDQFPRLLVSAGPGADLVLGPGASVLAAALVAAQNQAAAADPEAALAAGTDPQSLLDPLAARGVVPEAAAAASGTVTVAVPEDSPSFTVDTAARFVSTAGAAYAPSASVRFVSPFVTPGDGETNLEDVNGTWVGTFAATAVAAGSDGNAAAGAALSPVVPVVIGAAFYVSAAMTGGRDAETAAEVLARLPAAGAATTAATAAGARSLVLAAVPGADVRVVGYGHDAMARGASALGVSLPGRVDVRVRPEGPLESTLVRVQATLVAVVSSVGHWQFETTAGSPAAPVYASRVWTDGSVPEAGQSYASVSMGRGYDASALPDGADVRSAADAAFTDGGKLTWRFADTDTDVSGLTVGVSQGYYSAVIRHSTSVPVAQEALGGDASPSAGDCLARGPTPVVVTAAVSVRADPGVTVDEDAVAEAVAAGVNASGIVRTLSAGVVVAGSVMAAGVRIVSLTMGGTVYNPDGTTTVLAPGQQTLDPGDDGGAGLGDDVTGFYCDAEFVAVTVL